MKQLYEMQKKAKELQRQMESIKVEKSDGNRSLSILVNGIQKVESIQIDPSWLTVDKKAALESALIRLINDAQEAAQKQAAMQAAALMKDFKGLGIPGL
jgi:DNA-binding protein YbaB